MDVSTNLDVRGSVWQPSHAAVTSGASGRVAESWSAWIR